MCFANSPGDTKKKYTLFLFCARKNQTQQLSKESKSVSYN